MKTKSITTVLFITFFLGLSVFQSCDKSDLPPIDGDGQTYSTVEINGKTWFAENLNYKTPNSWCYNDSAANGATYGRLYTWEDAIDACPKGWHIPNQDEWNSNNPMDGHDFQVVMSGRKSAYDGKFYGLGNYTSWWTSDEKITNIDYSLGVHYSFNSIFLNYDYELKQNGYSIRCVKD